MSSYNYTYAFVHYVCTQFLWRIFYKKVTDLPYNVVMLD